jgi:hypothetical protein
MGDWQSILAVLPGVAAVINGFIAVLMAHFFQGKPRAKVIFVAVAGAIAVVAVGTTLYGQYLVVSQRNAEHAAAAALRDKLGDFITQGNALMTECGIPSNPAPLEPAEAWASTVETFLKEKMGASYVARFRDSTGGPLGEPNMDKLHLQLWLGIRFRVFRLEQFSGEISH